jgi:hypothetical protein
MVPLLFFPNLLFKLLGFASSFWLEVFSIVASDFSSQVSVLMGAAHPTASAGASSNSSIDFPFPSPVSTSLRIETLNPMPFKLVKKVPWIVLKGSML